MTSLVLTRSTNSLLIFGPRLCNPSLIVHSFEILLRKRSKTTVAHVSSQNVFRRTITAQKRNRLQQRCFTDVAIVASNDKYGNKQVISVTPLIYDYLLTNVREPLILQELREETATMRGSQMQVSPDQAQLLAMLVQILGAKKCIEVGVYTGYSSLAVALVLPESGYLLACERDAVSLEVAKRYYDRAGVTHKLLHQLRQRLDGGSKPRFVGCNSASRSTDVDVKHGLAADVLHSLIQKGETCSFDFAFVDADKRMYQEYFELLLQLVRVGGLIVIDNVLWHGKVADPMVNDKKTVSIRNFNRNLMQDTRVSISMVPIGDGMTICRKL